MKKEGKRERKKERTMAAELLKTETQRGGERRPQSNGTRSEAIASEGEARWHKNS